MVKKIHLHRVHDNLVDWSCVSGSKNILYFYMPEGINEFIMDQNFA